MRRCHAARGRRSAVDCRRGQGARARCRGGDRRGLGRRAPPTPVRRRPSRRRRGLRARRGATASSWAAPASPSRGQRQRDAGRAHRRARFRATPAALPDGLTVARCGPSPRGRPTPGLVPPRPPLPRRARRLHRGRLPPPLDAVVAEAGRLGLRLIVTLSNNWGDYGGIPMYLAWAGLPVGDGCGRPGARGLLPRRPGARLLPRRAGPPPRAREHRHRRALRRRPGDLLLGSCSTSRWWRRPEGGGRAGLDRRRWRGCSGPRPHHLVAAGVVATPRATSAATGSPSAA